MKSEFFVRFEKLSILVSSFRLSWAFLFECWLRLENNYNILKEIENGRKDCCNPVRARLNCMFSHGFYNFLGLLDAIRRSVRPSRCLQRSRRLRVCIWPLRRHLRFPERTRWHKMDPGLQVQLRHLYDSHNQLRREHAMFMLRPGSGLRHVHICVHRLPAHRLLHSHRRSPPRRHWVEMCRYGFCLQWRWNTFF